MSFRSELNQRFDRLLGEAVVSIILGKMLGDYIAFRLTEVYGTKLGLELGILIGVILFLFWIPIEKWLQGEFDS